MMSLPRATALETARVFAAVLAPPIAKGPIIRRPRIVSAAATLNLDLRAVDVMRGLRHRYGPGPLLLGRPRVRQWALILEPAQVRRVLDETPDPFSTCTFEKHAALSHFEPKVSLISEGIERAERRSFNEAVHESSRCVHSMGDRFRAIVRDEASHMLKGRATKMLDWPEFSRAWFRIVRRVIFGDGAANDDQLSALTARLRSRANWAFLAPQRRDLRRRFHARILRHVARAEEGSLAAAIARYPVTATTAPSHQIAQWLFAFDPAGMATFRSLALLAADRERAVNAAEEGLAYLRACVLESLRLWPTTPLILRETTRVTFWSGAALAPRTGVIVFAPYFHRDDERIPSAQRFRPERWIYDVPQEGVLVPFSAGPGVCPGRNVVLDLASVMLAAILKSSSTLDVVRPRARLDTARPLPGELNHATLAVAVG